MYLYILYLTVNILYLKHFLLNTNTFNIQIVNILSKIENMFYAYLFTEKFIIYLI